MLISESTAILHLPRLFNERHEAFFVLGDHDISELVHFSDLKNPFCKIPFFAVVEMVERKYIAVIEKHFTEEQAVKALGRSKTNAVFTRADDLTKRGALRFPAAALLFGELLTYCRYHELAEIDEDEIKSLNEFRNRFAHGGRSLIT
jgi:hypothetical protein